MALLLMVLEVLVVLPLVVLEVLVVLPLVVLVASEVLVVLSSLLLILLMDLVVLASLTLGVHILEVHNLIILFSSLCISPLTVLLVVTFLINITSMLNWIISYLS